MHAERDAPHHLLVGADRNDEPREVAVDLGRFARRVVGGHFGGKPWRDANALRASGVDSRRQRPVIDQAAAVVILQSYLDARQSRA